MNLSRPPDANDTIAQTRGVNRWRILAVLTLIGHLLSDVFHFIALRHEDCVSKTDDHCAMRGPAHHEKSAWSWRCAGTAAELKWASASPVALNWRSG